MRPALVLLAVPLLACAAKPTPTGDQLIPADATFLVGIDISGAIASETYGLFKPVLAKEILQLNHFDVFAGCGIDPAAARLSLIFGTDGLDDGAVVFTGDAIGDPTKVRCVADKLIATVPGSPKLTLHDRSDPQPPLDQDLVATIVDARTVVLATRKWVAPVHDLILGKGQSVMAGPSKDLLARADRSAHLWFAGKAPAKLATNLGASIGTHPKELYGLVDLAKGLRIDLDVGFGGPDHVAPLRKKVEEAGPMVGMFAPMIGLDPKSTDTIKFEMKGDEFHFEMAITTGDALALSKKMIGDPVAQDPTRDNPPPS